MLKKIACILCLLLIFTGCNQETSQSNMEIQEKPDFRIIGYATDASIPEIIPYTQLTHINYAFLLPNADGTITTPNNLWKLEKIVRFAHENGVEVLISVGGWGWDDEFEELAANPDTRNLFVQNILTFTETYNLDGVDMDWEYPDPGESADNFLKLMQGLREGLPAEKLLTAAVVAYGDEHGLGIPTESFPLLDFVNLMAYDGADHSSFAQAERSLAYWSSRQLPPEKTVLGLPFYARPNGTPYKKIIESDPAAAQLDEFDYYGSEIKYNGIPTIQSKTRMAIEQASGVMFWTLDHDAQGEYSLLGAINQVRNEVENTP